MQDNYPNGRFKIAIHLGHGFLKKTPNIFFNCTFTLNRPQSKRIQQSTRCILNDTSNVTDRVFAIFSKLFKTFKLKFQGSAKNI